MKKVFNDYQYNNTQIQQEENASFQDIENIVDELVEQGLPETLNLSNFASKVSREYGISDTEARSCIRLALKQSNNQSSEQEVNDNDDRYAQSRYYYQSGYSVKPLTSNTSKKDGMDSLSAYSNYNKLMFGIK